MSSQVKKHTVHNVKSSQFYFMPLYSVNTKHEKDKPMVEDKRKG